MFNNQNMGHMRVQLNLGDATSRTCYRCSQLFVMTMSRPHYVLLQNSESDGNSSLQHNPQVKHRIQILTIRQNFCDVNAVTLMT